MWLDKLILCSLFLVWVQANQDAQLEIPQGQLKGVKLETVYHNKPYYSFKGIPYARPNVGPKKFEAPEPADPWEGVYDATHYRSPCPFHCNIKKDIVGEEDCLYLNVYTPILDKDARKAVMIWFNPGGFNGGMASDALFAPDFLVEQDVVLVTFTSRLGAIGFLNTGDKNAPGNAGLKDQVMALKWVKDNIHYFGGCPSRVTLFGQSTGASAIQYHMMSPMSEGLFKAAILQSGSVFTGTGISYNAKEMSFMLGEALGIKTTDSAELVEKLAAFSSEELIEATEQMQKNLDFVNGRVYAFLPAVEPDFGQDVFLPMDPWSLLKAGKLADVPLMSGVTADEGAYTARIMIDQIQILNEKPDMFLPSDLNITDPNQRSQMGESLKRFYFGDKPASENSLDEYTMMISDLMFDSGLLMFNDVLSKQHSSPIYEYEFVHSGPFGIMKTLQNMPDIPVTHGDDMGYLFYSQVFKNLPEAGSPVDTMTRIMTKLWTNFAKENNPTSEMDDVVTVNWEPRGTEDKYMKIDVNLKMDQHLYKDRIDFWKDLYKDVLGN